MTDLITLILGGLTVTGFLASLFYLALGLQLNVGMGALRRLTAKRVRKYNKKVFLCRCWVSLIGGVIIILLFNQIFGRPLTMWAVCAAGIVIDLAIENLFTFARDIYANNQNQQTMENEILDDVFLIESEDDKVNNVEFQSVAEYAQATGGTFEMVEGDPEVIDGTPRLFELRYAGGSAPVETLEIRRPDGTQYFIGHVPRPPKKPTVE